MTKSRIVGGGVAAAFVTVCGLASHAAAGVVYAQSDLIAPAPTTLFIAHVHQELHRPPMVMLTWGTSRALAAGLQDVQVDQGATPAFDSYCLIGLDSAGGVLVSCANPTIALGRPFSSVFGGMIESQVADAIMTGGSPLLDQFITLLDTTPGFATPMGVACRTVHFSDGADYGSFIADFSPVPTPSAGVMIGVCGSLAVLRRRR